MCDALKIKQGTFRDFNLVITFNIQHISDIESYPLNFLESRVTIVYNNPESKS